MMTRIDIKAMQWNVERIILDGGTGLDAIRQTGANASFVHYCLELLCRRLNKEHPGFAFYAPLLDKPLMSQSKKI